MTQQTLSQTPVDCGFLNVLKPPGMSSAAVVGRVRRLLQGAKVGHAGTLDPEAAGVLPLMIGKAARLFDYLQDKQKEYVAEVAFGQATDTQDAQGSVLAVGANIPDEAAMRAVLPAFQGDLMQTPPMYSALKRDGRRLYDLARKGEQVAVDARPVTVHALSLQGMMPRSGALLRVACSKGFYVRTLCHDLGQALGCPAHMRFLLRTRSGSFTLDTAHTLESLAMAADAGTVATLLLPMDLPLAHLPSVDVPLRLHKPLINGIPLRLDALLALPTTEKPIRMYVAGVLTAIGEQQGELLRVRTWLGA